MNLGTIFGKLQEHELDERLEKHEGREHKVLLSR